MARIYSSYQFDDRIVMIQVHQFMQGRFGRFRRDIRHVFRRDGRDFSNLFAAHYPDRDPNKYDYLHGEDADAWTFRDGCTCDLCLPLAV